MTTPWYDTQKKGYEVEKQIEILQKENKTIAKNLRNKMADSVVLQGGYPPCGFYAVPHVEKEGKDKGKIRIGYVDLKLDTSHLSSLQIPTAILAGLNKRAISAIRRRSPWRP